MIDPAPEKRPESATDKWILGLFSAFIVLAFGAELLGQNAGVRWLLAGVVIAWAPMLVLHEFGHAWMARQVGFGIDRVVIGFGVERGRLRIAGVPVSIRTLPIEGFVTCAPKDLDGVRWRTALVYLAGPGIELVFAAVVILWIGPDATFSLQTDVGGLAARSVVLTALLGGVVNLMPHSTVGPRGEVVSDGLGILFALTGPIEMFEAQIRERRLEELRPRDLPDDAS